MCVYLPVKWQGKAGLSPLSGAALLQGELSILLCTSAGLLQLLLSHFSVLGHPGQGDSSEGKHRELETLLGASVKAGAAAALHLSVPAQIWGSATARSHPLPLSCLWQIPSLTQGFSDKGSAKDIFFYHILSWVCTHLQTLDSCGESQTWPGIASKCSQQVIFKFPCKTILKMRSSCNTRLFWGWTINTPVNNKGLVRWESVNI